MLQTHPTCKLQNSAFYIINSNKEASSTNSSGSLNQYREHKSPHGSKYHQIPERTGAFNTNNSPSPQGGFCSSNFFGGDGRSPQSTNRPSYPERLAETNGCSHVSLNMKTANGAATPDPNSSISCKYLDCNSINLQTRERPDTPHYAEIICCECGRHQKWLEHPETQRKREKQRKRVQELLFLKNRLNDWDRNFLNDIQYERKLSLKQLAQLDRIEREVGGLR